MKERTISRGYIKLLAIKIEPIEAKILEEINTTDQKDVEYFKKKYLNIINVILFLIHMNRDDNITFSDYKRISKSIGCFDYLVDLITKNQWNII